MRVVARPTLPFPATSRRIGLRTFRFRDRRRGLAGVVRGIGGGAVGVHHRPPVAEEGGKMGATGVQRQSWGSLSLPRAHTNPPSRGGPRASHQPHPTSRRSAFARRAHSRSSLHRLLASVPYPHAKVERRDEGDIVVSRSPPFSFPLRSAGGGWWVAADHAPGLPHTFPPAFHPPSSFLCAYGDVVVGRVFFLPHLSTTAPPSPFSPKWVGNLGNVRISPPS